jgi:hypothetical protein
MPNRRTRFTLPGFASGLIRITCLALLRTGLLFHVACAPVVHASPGFVVGHTIISCRFRSLDRC